MIAVLPILAGLSAWHAPHDSAYTLAAAPLPGGGEMQLIVGPAQKTLVSVDGGLTWEVALGDGLQTQSSFVIEFHPGLGGSGFGQFLVGTQTGIWAYDPLTREATKSLNGLGSGQRWFLDLDTPTSGDGPALAVTKDGDVLLLDTTQQQWSQTHQVGNVFANRTATAVSPAFDGQSSAAGARDLFVAANGQLWRSGDGGTSWTVSPQFNQVATQADEWLITHVELSADYENDGVVLVARGRMTPSGPTGDIGEIWRSSDFGLSFTRVHQLATGVSSLEASPVGPSGGARWFAAGRQYPGVDGYMGVGILRSDDGGLSWASGDTFQDFLLEDGPGKQTGAAELFFEQDLRIMPDYAQTGRIWYVRQEGIFVSDDEGVHWRQVDAIPPYRLRDAESALGPTGEKLVFAAAYGSGALLFDRTRGGSFPLPERTPMSFNKRIAVSPSFARDGQVALAGNVLLWSWQAPMLGPFNPNGESGWHFAPMRNPFTGRNMSGYPRGVRFSPRFDASTTGPGIDQTVFWFTAEGEVRRSEDNLATAVALPDTQAGVPTEPVHTLAIAPSYIAGVNRTDVYAGCRTGPLYRLDNEKWTELTDFDQDLRKLEISPTWNESSNRELFAVLKKSPFVVRILDQPGGAVVESLRYDLSQVEPTGIALNPGWANRRVLYLSTYASGVFRLDLDDAQPSWEPVGVGLPAVECQDVVLSADYANDRLVYAATTYGLWEVEDLPGEEWKDLTTSWTIDSTSESVQTLSPNNPLNGAPSHTWPWQTLRDYQLPPGTELLGDELRVAHFDQDMVRTVAPGIRHATLLTYKGPGFGRWRFEAVEVETGTVVASRVKSMSSGTLGTSTISLSFPQADGLIELRAVALLQSGEQLAFDGFEVRR